eukprot:m.214005 g.214005  ORF g.214005 m.214005 type:complete len:216 (-) comp15529_c0_seq8:105-752(-)
MASDPLFYTSMLPTGLEEYLRKNSETIKAAVAHKTAGYEGIPVSTRAQASLITRAFLTERRHEAKLMYETLRERSRNLEAEKQSYERMQTAAPLPAVMSAALGLVRRASPSVSDTVGKTLARFPLVGPAVVFAVGGLSAVGYTVYQIRKIEEIQKEKQHERWAALWQGELVIGWLAGWAGVCAVDGALSFCCVRCARETAGRCTVVAPTMPFFEF